MDAAWTKVLCTGLIVSLSCLFGFLPLLFSDKMQALSPSHPKYNKKKRKNVVLSFLLNFGGGVLIANCFCHWLPEVREGIEHKHIDTPIPLAEVIMCLGFFAVCFLEEFLHHCLHPHKPKTPTQQQQQQGRNEMTNKATTVDTSFNADVEKPSTKVEDFDDEDDLESNEETSTAKRTKAAIRTFFVVSALSFHSTIEGLALGIEDSTNGIWMNFGATAMHKFVIAFSVGVELLAAQTAKLNYFISILVFAFAPALGVGIAFLIGHFQSGDAEFDDFPLQVLQGIATGTVVYVVFFEIFPKGKEIGGTGFQHIVAMTLGFAIFVPSLFFHTHDDHDESGESTTMTSWTVETSTNLFKN